MISPQSLPTKFGYKLEITETLGYDGCEGNRGCAVKMWRILVVRTNIRDGGDTLRQVDAWQMLRNFSEA